MPETYIEPLTDRQVCHTCNKTVTGKKKLSKCSGCHAITYCGKECQVADFKRHKWNCLPVMVTEIPGKGRGLVAARDIKIGEQIFVDKPVISVDSDFDPVEEDDMKTFLEQFEKLPSEAKLQFKRLNLPKVKYPDLGGHFRNAVKIINSSSFGRDVQNMQKFINTSRFMPNIKRSSLYLNIALINHSCAPNVAEGPVNPLENVRKLEIRAIRNIDRGEEITKCYIEEDYFTLYCNSDRRRIKIRQNYGFYCRCQYCSNPDQEDITKKLLELHTALRALNIQKNRQKKRSDLARQAEILGQIVNLNQECNVGGLDYKGRLLVTLVQVAQLAGKEDLVKMAMNILKHLADVTKVEEVRRVYEKMEGDLIKCSSKELSMKEEFGMTRYEVD